MAWAAGEIAKQAPRPGLRGSPPPSAAGLQGERKPFMMSQQGLQPALQLQLERKYSNQPAFHSETLGSAELYIMSCN